MRSQQFNSAPKLRESTEQNLEASVSLKITQTESVPYEQSDEESKDGGRKSWVPTIETASHYS